MGLVSSGSPTSGRSVRFAVLAIFFAVMLLVFRSTAPDRVVVSHGSGMASGRVGATPELSSAGCPIVPSEQVGAGEFPMPPAGKLHVLVTGGAGFIGSHATMRLLEEGHVVTAVDNLSRGNYGAIKELKKLACGPACYKYINIDLGNPQDVAQVFRRGKFDAVIHFAAVAYVGESMAEPLRYYHNITTNTIHVMEGIYQTGVKRFIYSSTCATYGEPDKMPIVETTPQNPINPYGKAKKMAEVAIHDWAAANPKAAGIVILRYFNVIGSDPKGRVGEGPRPDLRKHSRISGACFDAALGRIDKLKILGLDYPTPDGTCIRDYIHVMDLVDAHIAALKAAETPTLQPLIYNVGVGKGYSVREFVNACLKVTGKNINVEEVPKRRPGDYAEVYSDPSKIYLELGWNATFVDLEESLGHAWNWVKSHPNGYDNSPY